MKSSRCFSVAQCVYSRVDDQFLSCVPEIWFAEINYQSCLGLLHLSKPSLSAVELSVCVLSREPVR